MRRLKHRQLRALALAIIDDARWIADHAQEITDRANSDVDEAQRAISYDGDGRGGNELTGPEAHVDRRMLTTRREDGTTVAARDNTGRPILRGDIIHETMTRFLGILRLARDNTRATRDLAGELITSRDHDDRVWQSSIASANPTAGHGHCGNCGRLCPGTRDDRIKSDRCSPGCYEFRVRHGAERPRALWPRG